MRTQVKVSADSAGTFQLELVLELFDAGAELVDLLDGDLRTQTPHVTSHTRYDISTYSEYNQQNDITTISFQDTDDC